MTLLALVLTFSGMGRSLSSKLALATTLQRIVKRD